MEVCEVVLYGEPTTGLGIGLESTVPPTCTLQDPPIVTRLEPNTAAERYGNHWKIHLYRGYFLSKKVCWCFIKRKLIWS